MTRILWSEPAVQQLEQIHRDTVRVLGLAFRGQAIGADWLADLLEL